MNIVTVPTYIKMGEIAMEKVTRKDYETGRDKLHYLLTLFLTLAALIAIVCYSFGSFYSIARKDVVTIGERTVSEESEKLNNFLLRGLDVLQVTGLTIDYMLSEGRDTEEIKQYLLQESKDYEIHIDKNFTGIYGLFQDTYIDGIGWVPEEDYVPKERPWYTAAIAGNGTPVVVSPYLDAQTGSIMISVSQMLSDGQSVVSLDIVMDKMQIFAEEMNLNGSGYGFIIDKTGLIVAHSEGKLKGRNFLTDTDEDSMKMRDVAGRIIQAAGNTLRAEIDGKPCMIFSKVVQEDWYVVMVIDTNQLFQQVQNNLYRNIFISLLIFALVVYFCTASYLNRIKALHYAGQLKEYQRTLEERVGEQTAKIKEQTQHILQMQEHVIECMATLIESRDSSTGQHVMSTKKYVSMIVWYMYNHQMHPEEVNKEYIDRITNAAALHDVGKIMISDTILNKPGKFTPEEFEIMKTHSRLGSEIVQEILGENADQSLVRISSDVARYHHEKWDGTGYPEGLKGQEIPLCARIMAVADVFDALVSKRVYKDGIPLQKAFSILQEESGSHFDPQIIEVFMAIRQDVEAYLRQSFQGKA